MVKESVNKKTVEVGAPIKKGSTAVGIIKSIEDGTAEDFMSEAQYIARQCQPDEPYTELSIEVEGATITKTFKDYTRIGSGVVSPNTLMGEFCSLYEMEEGAKVNMIARELEGKNGGKNYVVWDIVK